MCYEWCSAQYLSHAVYGAGLMTMFIPFKGYIDFILFGGYSWDILYRR